MKQFTVAAVRSRSERAMSATGRRRLAAPFAWPPTRFVLAVILVGSSIRVALAAALGLGVDESYAVSVARTFSLSYVDHSPISFWIPGAVQWLGGNSAVLLRLPFILLFAGTTWLMFRLGARLYGEWAGAFAALVVSISPVFSISTGGWVLPDGPLMFFMLASALCVAHALFDDAPASRADRWWRAGGVLAGLAMLSKYTGIFLLGGTLLFVATTRDKRAWLRHPAPYLAAVIALLIFTPVLLWNAEHGWVSFRFQGARGEPHGVHPLSLLQSLGGQAAYILPWIWLPLLWLLVRGVRRGPRDAKGWFLCCLALGPIVAFTLPALGGDPGLPHWGAPGYLMLFPLLGAAVAAKIARGSARARRWLVMAITAFLVLVAVLASQTATGWMTRMAPSLFARGDPTLEALDWRGLRAALRTRELLPARARFVAATSWIDAGKLAYVLGPRVPVICLCANPHQFGYLLQQREFIGDDALIIVRARPHATTPVMLASYFDAVDSLAPVMIRRAGHPAITLGVYLAHHFRRPYPSELPP